MKLLATLTACLIIWRLVAVGKRIKRKRGERWKRLRRGKKNSVLNHSYYQKLWMPFVLILMIVSSVLRNGDKVGEPPWSGC